MTKADLMWLFISATIIIVVSLLLYKEWKLLIFDPVYAKGIGLPIEALKATLTVLIVMTIVTGIQAVGVILMSALLIIPAASAKLWTKIEHNAHFKCRDWRYRWHNRNLY